MVEPKRHTPLLNGSLKNLFFPPEKDEYSYFQVAAAHLFPAADYLAQASWAADAAMLSYARYGARRMDDDELARNLKLAGLTLRAKIGENPRDWNAPGTQAFFAAAGDFAILAFRGTEIDDPNDGSDDLDILLVPEPDYSDSSAAALGHLAIIEHLFTAAVPGTSRLSVGAEPGMGSGARTALRLPAGKARCGNLPDRS